MGAFGSSWNVVADQQVGMLLQRWWDLEDCVSKLTRFIFNSTLQQCTKVPRAMSHNNLEPQHKNAWGLTRHTSIKLSLSSLYCHPTKDNTQLDSKQSSDFNHFSIILNHETKTHHQPTASMLPCYCSASEARISLLVPSFEVSNKSSPELSRHCTIPYAAAVYTCNMAAEKPTELLYYKSGKEVNLT